MSVQQLYVSWAESTLQALTAIQKAGPAEFTSRPAILATRLALLEANEDLQGAKSLAQGSLQAADRRGQPKGQSVSSKAVLYETLARVQLKVLPSFVGDFSATCITAPSGAAQK